VPNIYCTGISFHLFALRTIEFKGERTVSRFLSRAGGFFGDGPSEQSEVDHWIGVADALAQGTDTSASLDKALLLRTFLVGHSLSYADVAVFVAMLEVGFEPTEATVNLWRWFDMVGAIKEFSTAIAMKPSANGVTVAAGSGGGGGGKAKKGDKGGSFFKLEGIEHGIVTRFPPEASGFLHIGHAKAALINNHLARVHDGDVVNGKPVPKGRMIMRFDDTNPAKESAEFEAVILDDLKMLQIEPDVFTHTSDHFDALQQYAQKLVDEGKAFVDDTPAEVCITAFRLLIFPLR
jgi:bifunctional glutamyl/prolyl-tRNA synthetase